MSPPLTPQERQLWRMVYATTWATADIRSQLARHRAAYERADAAILTLRSPDLGRGAFQLDAMNTDGRRS